MHVVSDMLLGIVIEMKQIIAVMKKQFKNHWFLQHKEGAPASCRAFNNRWAWTYRGNNLCEEFARKAMLTDDLYCNIDRAIITPPGAGCDKMPHSKRLPFQKPEDFSIEAEYYAVDTEFLAIPGSHKLFWDLRRGNADFHDDLDKDDVEFCLDVDNDPMDLKEQCKAYNVPQGCIVFWHSDLLRATRKNRKSSIIFGQKLGYTRIYPSDNPQNASDDKPSSVAFSRYEIWRKGLSPRLYPSGEQVHLYPKIFREKPSAWAEICDRISQSKSEGKLKMTETPLLTPSHDGGMLALHVEEIPAREYIPFPLSEVGKALLVGKKHVKLFGWNTRETPQDFSKAMVDENSARL